MKITVREIEGVVVVGVDSSVLQEHVPIFRERLLDLIANDKCHIVVDMFEAAYMSSMSISTILEIKRKAQAIGGDVILANVNKLILNLFQITNLLKAIAVVDSVEDAVAVFAENP